MPELPSEVAALRRIKFFEELTDADLSRLARIGQRRSYAAGDAIVERDSDRGGFFVLLSGEAEVEVGGTFHVLASGDFFGETALLAGSRRTATVRATEPVQAMVFEPVYFRPFLIENPSVAVTLLEVLADRLNAVQAQLEAPIERGYDLPRMVKAAEAAEKPRVVGEPERSLHVDPRSVETNTRSSRMPNAGSKRARRLAMMDDTDPIENPRRTIREQVQPRRVERLLIVRPQDGADEEAARSELEDLPGVVGVTLNTVTRSFDIAFDSAVVSDDELAAALHHHGYDLISWQEVIHAAQQRTWLLEQIQALAPRAELELAARGTYADGFTKGSVDAYVRAARAFGLVTDAEIIQLIPARFFKGPD